MHQEKIERKAAKKISSPEKQISPAARKMASEAKVDLSGVEGSGKKWCDFERGYNESYGV